MIEKYSNKELVEWLDEHKAPYQLIKEKDGSTTKHYDTPLEWFVTIITELENKKSDVAKVIRCKDCKYWQDNNGGYPHLECRWGHDETPDENDYCSYAERKDKQ